MTAQAARKTDNLIPTGERKEAMVKAYKENMTKRFQATLARRVERLESQIADEDSDAYQVILRKVKAQGIRAEITVKRAELKVVQKEIKALRGNKTRNRGKGKGKEVQATK